jgi:hypothetical protein
MFFSTCSFFSVRRGQELGLSDFNILGRFRKRYRIVPFVYDSFCHLSIFSGINEAAATGMFHRTQ